MASGYTQQDIEKMAAEIDSLRSQLAAKEEVVSTLESDIAKLESNAGKLESNVVKLESNISKLEYELSWLRKKLFGKMSERFINSDPDSRQLDIFGEQLGENEREELEKAAKLEQELITKTITVTKTRTPRKDVSFENLQSFPTAPSTNAWQIRVF
jgi:transposase